MCSLHVVICEHWMPPFQDGNIYLCEYDINITKSTSLTSNVGQWIICLVICFWMYFLYLYRYRDHFKIVDEIKLWLCLVACLGMVHKVQELCDKKDFDQLQAMMKGKCMSTWGGGVMSPDSHNLTYWVMSPDSPNLTYWVMSPDSPNLTYWVMSPDSPS
jgi:hypothetical protein